MERKELRAVEYTITEKKKSKNGKKTSKKTKRTGFFHKWGSKRDKKDKEEFFALVEESKTGKLTEVSYKDIRFISAEVLAKDDVMEAINEGIAEANVNPADLNKVVEKVSPEEIPAEIASEITPADNIEKPKPVRKTRSVKKQS